MEGLNLPTCSMAAPHPFESLPAEIRNMIYRCLFNPSNRSLTVRPLVLQYRCTHVSNTSKLEILRTNRNINREASAVLYRDVILVSLDWHASERAYLSLLKPAQGVPFHFVPSGALLPPCIVHIQQRYDNKSSNAAPMSTIVAATDFPALCDLMLMSYLIPRYEHCKTTTSYSVISLPKVGYDVERLRGLIWTPLLAVRKGHLRDLGDRIQRKIGATDCTGVFEHTPAVSDWNRASDDENEVDPENQTDEGERDLRVSEVDSNDEGDGDMEYSDEGEAEEDGSGNREDCEEEDSYEGR